MKGKDTRGWPHLCGTKAKTEKNKVGTVDWRTWCVAMYLFNVHVLYTCRWLRHVAPVYDVYGDKKNTSNPRPFNVVDVASMYWVDRKRRVDNSVFSNVRYFFITTFLQTAHCLREMVNRHVWTTVGLTEFNDRNHAIYLLGCIVLNQSDNTSRKNLHVTVDIITETRIGSTLLRVTPLLS